MTVLHTYDLGRSAGAPLLAVHGITGHGRRWERLATEGWPHRRTLAVDLRGHGHSTDEGPWNIERHVSDLLDTLDAHAITDPVDVVGHSYGGAIGMHLLATAPARIARLVMLDPAFALPGDRVRDAAVETIEHLGWETIEDARRWRSQDLDPPALAHLSAELDQHLVRHDDGRYRFRFSKAAVVTGWSEIARSVPQVAEPRHTLMVIARAAGLVTEPVEAEIRRELGVYLHVETIDCGHMLYWERFDETVVLVNSFLA